jgi:3-oxoacyl-[acyl-carrier-protein] synthase II
MGAKRARRVVITGLGVVAPNGIGKDAFWQNLIAGKSAIDYITAFDPSPFPCQVAGEVRDFRPEEFMTRQRARELWRFTHFALAASRMAIEDAKLQIDPINQEKIGVCFGTCVNGFEKIEESYEIVKAAGYTGLHPLTCFQYSTHAPVSHVAIEFGIKGPSMTLASGCSTGLDVIKWGYDQIQAGIARAIIAGSTEAPLTALSFATFCALGILTKSTDPRRASRPFDFTRDGLVLAEGAGALVVEDMESAVDRGAPIYAEVTGFGLTSEALHLRKRDPSGAALARAIHLALSSSGATVGDIDYINSHGNSMVESDRNETAGIKAAFGDRAYSIPVSSIKSMIGQPIAASGALQAISTALTIYHGIIPPTINYETPDPECDLDYVPNESRISRVRKALVNAHALGGTHSVLTLERPSF